jgi:hypothetical protein
MEVYTFSKDNWIPVIVPYGLDGQELYYASVWAFLTNVKDIPDKKASVIAEAAAMKRLYPGLMYGSVLERELKLTRE